MRTVDWLRGLVRLLMMLTICMPGGKETVGSNKTYTNMPIKIISRPSTFVFAVCSTETVGFVLDRDRGMWRDTVLRT